MELINIPLQSSGFKLERNELAQRILAQTNYFPILIQIYCGDLINTKIKDKEFLKQRDLLYTITTEDIDDCYHNKELGLKISDKFSLTLQLDSRYE